jgi:hypothetical protein
VKKRIPLALVKRGDVLAPVFNTIANDFVLQQYFGVAYNARYVTDLPGEAEFFTEISKNDSLAMQTAALCARLTHTIPMMSDLPLETVLKVRDAEPEAFLNYRSTITSIVKNHVHSGTPLTDSEAKEIYTDELLPKLQRLEAKAHQQRRSKIKGAAVKALASSAVLALGIYSGLLPATGTQVMTALGGLSVAKDIAEGLGAIEKNPVEIRNHNLFFLLRLKQAGKV